MTTTAINKTTKNNNTPIGMNATSTAPAPSKSRTRSSRAVSHVEKYAMAIAQQLETPHLLSDSAAPLSAIQRAVEEDVKALQEIAKGDRHLIAHLLECLTTLNTAVPGRAVEKERRELLAKMDQGLPEVGKDPIPSEVANITFYLRGEILKVAARPEHYLQQLQGRGLVGRRTKLNASGTVQRFVDHRLRVDDKIRDVQQSKTRIRKKVSRGRYVTSTKEVFRVTDRFEVHTTEYQRTVERTLAGVEELELGASIDCPQHVATFIEQCKASMLGRQFRIALGGLCDYRESDESIRSYCHFVSSERMECVENRNVHYSQIGRDIGTAALVVGAVGATVGLALGVAALASSPAIASTAATTIVVSHVDPVICWGPYALVGFLPEGFDLSAFKEQV